MDISISQSNSNIPDKILDYVNKYNPVVYILTPCYAGLCYVNYLECIVKTIELFKYFNIKLIVQFCKNDSLVSRARNNLVARAMHDLSMTHIMFIDNDITWNPFDILKLLLSDKPIIGGAYPLKQYKWDRLAQNGGSMTANIIEKKRKNSALSDSISDVDMIKYNMVNYNINYLSNNLEINENITKVKYLATGFMMIQRNVIEKMQKSFPSTKYVDDVNFLQPQENEFAYALFDCGVEDGRYMSEDWLFCQRWSKMGGNVYLDVGINLTHTGTEDFNGSYITSIL
jgi:hypothetical protein